MNLRINKRRYKDIDRWVEASKHLNLGYLKENLRVYCKINVYPWSRISFANSKMPRPTGLAKIIILNGLIEIYEAWKIELDKLEADYYLKIWLFEPRFLNSQVVCAIGECLDFYEHTFFKPDRLKELKFENYGWLKNKLLKFDWEYRLDEDHFDNSMQESPELYATLKDYEEEKRRFEKMIKMPHRITKFGNPIGGATASYSFNKGDIWIGGK